MAMTDSKKLVFTSGMLLFFFQELSSFLLSSFDHSRLFISRIAFVHYFIAHVETIISSWMLALIKMFGSVSDHLKVMIQVPSAPVKDSHFSFLKFEFLVWIYFGSEAFHEVPEHFIAGHFQQILHCACLRQIVLDWSSSDNVSGAYVFREGLE